MIKKVILDTDIGDDIDDALALALVLESPEIELIGITTVFKNVKARSNLVHNLLQAYNKHIPVHEGIGMPFINRVDCTEIPIQCEGLDKISLPQEKIDAVDFIINQAQQNSEIVIAAIGPLTNIAMAIVKAPEIMKKAKIVLMGGMHSFAYPEWNIVCDPEAAKIVLESDLDVTMVGLDVTLQCRLNDEEYNKMIRTTTAKGKFLISLLKKWMGNKKSNPILHDPLVIGYLISPDILNVEIADMKVELKGEITRGVTVNTKNVFDNDIPKRKNIKVANGVNREKFISLFLERVFN